MVNGFAEKVEKKPFVQKKHRRQIMSYQNAFQRLASYCEEGMFA